MDDHAILVVDDLTKHFGGVVAVEGASFAVPRGSITGLIGPNGAGKTTAFDLITGRQRPDRGTVHLDGHDVTRLAMDRRARKGLLRTFQIPRPFLRMTVWENLLLAGSDVADETITAALTGHDHRSRRRLAERAGRLLELLTLDHLADEPASSLSGGQRKLLELGRVLMLDPQIVLLDEPTAGVAPELRIQLAYRLRRLNDEGLTLLVVEHDLPFLLGLVDRLVIMHLGQVLMEGDPDEVRRDERVLEVYLGGVHA